MPSKLTIPKTPTGVKAVIFSDEIGDTPANANLRTRIIKLNPEYWKLLNDDQKAYIIEHEAGHINLQTHNEFEADDYASMRYFAAKRSPKQSVFAISKVLPLTNEEQRRRLNLQLQRAVKYDYTVNKNINALKYLNKMSEDTENELDHYEASFEGDYDDDNFGGRFARNRAKRHDRRELRKNSKIERKNTRANSKAIARETKSQAKLTKAQNGDTSGSAEDIFQKSMEGLQAVGDTVAKIKGTAPASGGEEAGTDSGKILGMKASVFYIVAGVVVIVVVAGLWLALKPKKALKTA